MLATISYIVAAVYGAQISPYALVATTIVDIAVTKTISDWVQARALAQIEQVPVALITEDAEALEDSDVPEDMALDADEVEDVYG